MSLKLRFDSKNYFYAGPVLYANECGFIRFYKEEFKEYCVWKKPRVCTVRQ